jgi:hypothetical protein
MPFDDYRNGATYLRSACLHMPAHIVVVELSALYSTSKVNGLHKTYFRVFIRNTSHGVIIIIIILVKVRAIHVTVLGGL